MLNTTNSENLFSSSNSKNFKTIFDIHKTNSYTTLQTTLQSYKMPITTDYNVFAQKYHKPFNSAMEGIIAHVQNQNTLIKELREENEFYKNGFIELCEEYEGDGEWSFEEVKCWINNLNEENEKLKNENEKIVEKYEKKLDTQFKEFCVEVEEMEKLKEENEKLKNEKEKIVEKTTQHLNMAETLYEGAVKENEKLEEEMEELERKYDNLVEKVGEDGYEFDTLEDKVDDLEEEVCNLNRNIRMDKSIIQNLILSLIATQNDDMEWKMKDKYDIAGVDIYEKYKNEMINELIKDMNNNDWNDDNNGVEIIYEDKNFRVVFNDTESEEEEK